MTAALATIGALDTEGAECFLPDERRRLDMHAIMLANAAMLQPCGLWMNLPSAAPLPNYAIGT